MYHGEPEHCDQETGFLDAEGLERVIEAEFSRVARHQLPVSLVLLEVSAERARLSGDELAIVVAEVAATISERIRGEDHAARVGPLRFAVLAVETSDSETIAANLAEHVRQTLERSPRGGGLTVSTGAVDCQFDELSRDELMREAERSLAAAILAGVGVGFPAGAESSAARLPHSSRSASR